MYIDKVLETPAKTISRNDEQRTYGNLLKGRFDVRVCRIDREDDNKQYDLIAFFDCLHDLGDPVGAASHALKSLKRDGTVMVIEPFANDRVEDNFNPLGRLFYAASAMACVPGSMACNGPALGAQAGETKIREVVMAGGFKQSRRATLTTFNIVYEAIA